MSDKILQAMYMFAENGNEPMRLLKESGIDCIFNDTGKRATREYLIEVGKDCTGVVAAVEPYDAEVMDAMPRLRCISRCGVGIDSIDMKAAADRGIVVRNTPGVVVQPVVELTVAMVFDLMRKITLHTNRLQRKEWSKTPGNLIAGKTFGVVGLGAIGRRISETFIALGAQIIGSDIAPDIAWAEKHGVEIASTADVLARADVLCLHMSILAENPFKLGANEIDTMKDGAWVINTSRGELIDDIALAKALEIGKLSGAGLDVFPQEPYVGPLCDLENVVLTPHIATLTRESRFQMEVEAVQNLLEELAK